MRIRSLKPEFFRDPDTTGRWPPERKIFYVGMWCFADDEGRFPWEPDLIAADLYPYDRSADVAGLLDELRAAGRVLRYEVDGRAYGLLVKFRKHQKINRPTPSRLPPPPAGLTEDSVSHPGGLTAGKEQGSGKGSGISDQGSGAEPVADAPAPAPASPVVLSLKCSGSGPKAYDVTQAQVDAWATAFPGVDVLAEVRKSAAWQDANPGKRKTHKGMASHLVNWLGRAQDGAGGRQGPQGGKALRAIQPAASHAEHAEEARRGVTPWGTKMTPVGEPADPGKVIRPW